MGQFSSRSGEAELQQEGPRIRILISAPQDEIEVEEAFGEPYPNPIGVFALIDTGASLTVVNPELAKSCKLKQTGFAQVSSAGQLGKYPRYAARIQFPDAELRGFDVIPVVGCKLPQQSISCLIGRDVLRRWTMIYSGRLGEFSVRD